MNGVGVIADRINAILKGYFYNPSIGFNAKYLGLWDVLYDHIR